MDVNVAENQMKIISSKIKKLDYLNTNSCLGPVLTYITDAKKALLEAENYLKDGGYVDNGDTYDEGLLKDCRNNLDTINTEIESILNAISSRKAALTAEYNKYAAIVQEAN